MSTHTKTVWLNPAGLKMHGTRRLLPVPSKERVDAIARAIKSNIKLPPIYIVSDGEPCKGLVVAGWTRKLAHQQMQRDIECIVVSELEAEEISIGENTNRQMYSYAYQVAWIYTPLALFVVEASKKRQLENLKRGPHSSESPASGLSREISTMEDVADRIGVSRTLMFEVKKVRENILKWDAEHPPCRWGDGKEKLTAMEYCHAKILCPDKPCSPGQAWAGVNGKEAAQNGETKPTPRQLDLFIEGMASVAKWGKSFTKFEGDQRDNALKAIKKTVAALPSELREEIASEIRRLAREEKEGK